MALKVCESMINRELCSVPTKSSEDAETSGEERGNAASCVIWACHPKSDLQTQHFLDFFLISG